MSEAYVEGGDPTPQLLLGTYHTTVTDTLSATDAGDGGCRGNVYTVVVAGNDWCYIVDTAAAAVVDIKTDVCRLVRFETTVSIVVGEDNVADFEIVGRIGGWRIVVVAAATVSDTVVVTVIGITIAITVVIVSIMTEIAVALAFLLYFGACHTCYRTGNTTDESTDI